MLKSAAVLLLPCLLASCAPSMMSMTASTNDGLFLQAATGSNLFKIPSSQLAVSKAATPAVKAYAQHLIDDHTLAQQKVAALAATRGVVLPKVLPPELQLKINSLSSMSGAAFEGAYLREQVLAHQLTLSVLQNEQMTGKDTAVVDFANQQVPVIQQHLQEAQAQTPAAS